MSRVAKSIVVFLNQKAIALVILNVRKSIFNLEMSHGLTPMRASSTILLLEQDFKTKYNSNVKTHLT